MTPTMIDRLYEENLALVQYLEAANEISLRNNVVDAFRKTLLLSAASHFEREIRECILDFVTERAKGDAAIISLLKAKAIERQYHTYFDWAGKNANQFFALFGSEFKDFMKRIVDTDEDLQSSIRAFLELGNLRNQLVHIDFANFPIEKTAEEIYALYKQALRFVQLIPIKLREFSAPGGT